MIPVDVYAAEHRTAGLISVILASRRRETMLRASMASLFDTASRPDLVEVLVAHDPDDPHTADVARECGARWTWCAPERYGYKHGARYYAHLIEHVKGEWCLPSWGDDGIMLTQGWDDIVRAALVPSVLFTTGGDRWGNNCFPVVHMDVFVATGRFCDLPAIDTWYDDVGKLAGIWRSPSPPITLMQDRYDITGNNWDLTYVEGRSGYRARDYYSPQWKTWREQDALSVMAMVEFGYQGRQST
jgi:hypothetical protein